MESYLSIPEPQSLAEEDEYYEYEKENADKIKYKNIIK